MEVLSSLVGRVVSTISPQGSRAGADVALSKAPGTGRRQVDSEGLSPRLLQDVWFPTGALVPNHSLLEKSVNF